MARDEYRNTGRKQNQENLGTKLRQAGGISSDSYSPRAVVKYGMKATLSNQSK